MELIITLKKDRISLPIASGHTIQGLFYKALSADASFATSLHQSGKTTEGRNFKLFTFSEPVGRYETDGKIITYIASVKLFFRAADPYIIQLLFSYFSGHKKVMLGENEVAVADVTLADNGIFEDRAHIKTLSPITVYQTEENGHTTYFSPDDPRFCRAIEKNAQRKWKSSFGDEPFDFHITPCENARFTKRATRFKETFITAYHGEFIIEGHPKILNFLYHSGLGAKNSEGFGMFSVK